MTIQIAIEHATRYRFDRPVRAFPHIVRLRPAPHCRTPITAYSLQVEPGDHFINWQQDPFGNHLARLVFPEPITELSFTVDLVADMTVINPFDFFVDEDARTYPFRYDRALARGLGPYFTPVDADGPMLLDWVADIGHEDIEPVSIVDFLVEVNGRLHRDIAYSVRMEVGVQAPEHTLERGIGSCRDSAWLLVQILRRLGMAARFVSGYLVQLRTDIPSLDGAVGPTSDFTDLHAWAEVFVPGAGWIGLDPTSGLMAGEGHIPLACTPEPENAAPVTGSVEPCETIFSFHNVVRRIHEDPRVTLPYDSDQWHRIDALGLAVDERLSAGDVRLTVGGEPTFVAVDDMESPEWTIAADGPDKRARASALANRLRNRMAPGSVTLHTQGKWYPGEPLPRWQLELVWRSDETALWRDQSLLVDPWTPAPAVDAGTDKTPSTHGTPSQSTSIDADAARLVEELRTRLGLPEQVVLEAHEDPLHALLAQVSAPLGERPGEVHDALVDPPRALSALAHLDGIDSDTVAGWVMPLHRRAGSIRWATCRWRFRRGQLFLLPGDSPLGLRLPLNAVSWTPPDPVFERSPFEDVEALATPETLAETSGDAELVDTDGAPTTAMCVQVRDGLIFVFLPPFERAEDAAELLAVVEDAAAAAAVRIVLEGYGPPRDERLRHLLITPDPGVIEVNVQPTSTWPELRDLVEGLYDDARHVKLSTERFDLDGAHSGTGGGNHLTLGGAKPADSPLLRRPDLLRSMVTYWQHHPSLSYLFSGRFIGPTSQAPRVDEGRPENLYELEIAFAELERLGDDPAPWLVDRLLRNLLIDVTGNTHRAEFCIDKLFNPGSERGRLGLLEMRGFEMPPHWQMSLVQHLLVRSLVARFWDEPYEAPLIRWESTLHDRFLLPWYVAQDIADVIDDLRRHGIAFELGWMAPFLEFRFPRIGQVHVAGTTLELRSAIEPWHVLGEELSGNGTARYVDSSVERLQVRIEGLVESRHLVTCNGHIVPLQPTETPGLFVAGVRYRAWSPPSALHPTIEAHGPLVFDVIDKWSNRSLGGCTYHIVHPGGRNFERFPVNANEAESRRVARFSTIGHTPGPVDLTSAGAGGANGTSVLTVDRDYPHTLDLRRTQVIGTRAHET